MIVIRIQEIFFYFWHLPSNIYRGKESYKNISSKNIDILTGKCIAKKVRQRDSVSAFSTLPTICTCAQRHLPGEMARTRRQHLMVELLMLPRHLWTQLTAESAIGARDAFFKGPYWGCNRPLSPPMPLSLLWN